MIWGFSSGSDGKASICNAEDPGSIPGLGRSPEKEMAAHSSILAWKIPWITCVHTCLVASVMSESL